MNVPVFQKRELYDLIHNLLVFMKSKFERVSLLCHDLRDIPFATSFGDNVDFYYTPNVDDYLLTVQNAELVVSFRVHASLPSYALGTDFVNISYDERGLSLMETIGLKEWDVNLMDGNVLDAVRERVLTKNKPDIKDSKIVQDYRQKQKQFFKDIL
jgi:polysaccharide pyruvyl transferase WcaK-like protein